jgi:hypothetical protein
MARDKEAANARAERVNCDIDVLLLIDNNWEGLMQRKDCPAA